jgi:hypothetical protein
VVTSHLSEAAKVMNLFDDALSEKLAATIVLSGILPAYCAGYDFTYYAEVSDVD